MSSARSGLASAAGAWAIGLALVAGVALLYAPATGFEFLLSDDTMYVAANPWVRSGVTAAGFEWAFTTFEASNWHPATWLSLMLDAELFGVGPAGFHRTNIALHALAVVFAFAALRSATGRPGLAAFVAAVLAVHPAHLESVAWIPGRKDVLAAAFGLAALWAYVHYAQRGGMLRYAAVVGLGTLGMLAKPVLVTWPCVLLLLDVWPLGRWTPGGIDGRAGVADDVPQARAATPLQLLLEKAPLFASSVAVGLATMAAQAPAMGAAATVPFAARLENAIVSLARYLGRYVWPQKLGFIDPLPALSGESWGALFVGASLALGLVIGIAAARARRRAPFVTVGFAWFVGVLVPMLGLVQVGTQATADRYTYLPYLGVSLALAWSVDGGLRRAGPAARGIATALAALFVVGLAARTAQQLPVWRGSESLFAHALEVAPGAPQASVALANSYLAAGDTTRAAPLVQRALERAPDDGPALETQALLRAMQGDLPGAIRAQQRAVSVHPERPRPWLQLGKLLQAVGRDAEAIEAYERSLAIQPEQFGTLRLVGTLLAREGREAEAEARFDAAASGLAKRAANGIGRLDAEQALGWLAIERGRPTEAEPHFARVLAERPTDRGALRGRARAKLDAGDGAAALTLAREALAKGGEDPETRAIEINALEAVGEREQAIAALRTMIAHGPSHPLASWARERLRRLEARPSP